MELGSSRLLNRRIFCQLFAFLLTALLTGTYVAWSSLIASGQTISADSRNHSTEVKSHGNSSLKRILLWNSPHRIEASAFGTGHQAFLDAQCPFTDCLIVANSSHFWKRLLESDFQLLEKFDAVLFNVHELWLSSLPPPQYRRPPRQRFVFFTQESPQTMTTFDPENYDNFFNWTMTYRFDSDVRLLYGRFHSVNSTVVNDTSQSDRRQRKKKTNTIAWMVSHCETASKREEYVRQLQDHIAVDVYGHCGTFECARNDSHWLSSPECYVQLASQYKFYLSFENSFCNDYVTEKFFSVLQHDLVPIVLGSADYSLIAPSHSYIDVAQFKSPADLAAYLLQLDADEELYDKYFEWKSQFVVEAGVNQMSRHAFCDLCAKLHEEGISTKSYASMVSQWSPTTQCHN